MKLEIDLDLDKIDYEAINQQIQQKITDLDLATAYQIDTLIQDNINAEINSLIRQNMYRSYWNDDIDTETRNKITTEINLAIKNAVVPIVQATINKIPNDEFMEMFIKAFPVIYMNVIKNAVEHNYYADKGNAEAFVNSMITSRLENYIHI